MAKQYLYERNAHAVWSQVAEGNVKIHLLFDKHGYGDIRRYHPVF
ncbi:hypothetical protein [Lampropedia puyangensis]|nr:hypothetical protein [Lampropedia puyangensis]